MGLQTKAPIIITIILLVVIFGNLALEGIKNWVQELKPEDIEKMRCFPYSHDLKSRCIYYVSFRYNDTSLCNQTVDPEFCNRLAEGGYSPQYIRFKDQEVREGISVYGIILDVNESKLHIVVQNDLEGIMEYGLKQTPHIVGSIDKRLTTGQAGIMILPVKYNVTDEQYVIENVYLWTFVDEEHNSDKLELLIKKMEDDWVCEKAMKRTTLEWIDVCLPKI